MSLNFERFYKVKPNDDLGSSTFWNSRFQDIDLRLNAAESQFDKFDTASQAVIDAGILRINTTFQPLLDSLITQTNTTTAAVVALQNTVITDQDSITVQLNALLSQAQALVANLQSLGTIEGGTF